MNSSWLYTFASFALLISTVALAPRGARGDEFRVFFGTYTGAESRGIYTCTFDTQTGTASDVRLAAETQQPSFVAVHPSGNYLFAVNETVDEEGQKSGGVSAFTIDPESGSLTLINRQLARGGAPCHLICSPDGRFVLVANYVGGNVATLAINDDGSLKPVGSLIQHQGSSVNQARQESPHAHSINLDPAAHFAIAADLGTDRLYVHGYNEQSGELSTRPEAELSLPPGSGPRHFAFHPDGKHAFVINELTSTLGALRWNADAGSFELLSIQSTLPGGEPVPGNSTAEVVVHPSGKFVYGSNRGHNSLAIYQWNSDDESLTHVGNQSTLGGVPRNFAIDPTGRFLFAANQDTGNVVIFEIDQESGELHEKQQIEVPRCVCVRFLLLSDGSR